MVTVTSSKPLFPIYIAVAFFCNILCSCEKGNEYDVVLVSSRDFKIVDENHVIFKGFVSAKGGNAVQEHGFIWIREEDMKDKEWTRKVVGAGSGWYEHEQYILQGFKYRFKAFARCNDRDYFGESVTVCSSTKPILSTKPISWVSNDSVASGGIIVWTGDSKITEAGICISDRHNPTIKDIHYSIESDANNFFCEGGGLKPNRIYYLRSFAINSSKEIGYGEELEFITTSNTLKIFQSVTIGLPVSDPIGIVSASLNIDRSPGNEIQIQIEKRKSPGGYSFESTDVATIDPNTQLMVNYLTERIYIHYTSYIDTVNKYNSKVPVHISRSESCVQKSPLDSSRIDQYPRVYPLNSVPGHWDEKNSFNGTVNIHKSVGYPSTQSVYKETRDTVWLMHYNWLGSRCLNSPLGAYIGFRKKTPQGYRYGTLKVQSFNRSIIISESEIENK